MHCQRESARANLAYLTDKRASVLTLALFPLARIDPMRAFRVYEARAANFRAEPFIYSHGSRSPPIYSRSRSLRSQVRHNGQRLVGYMTSELKGLFHSDPSYDDDDEEPWDGDFGTEITFNSPPSLTPIPSPSPSLGTVCINLQQTPLDGAMSLRVFGKSDDVLRLLLAELGLDPPRQQPTDFSPAPRRFLVPYDETGKRTCASEAKRAYLIDELNLHSLSPCSSPVNLRSPLIYSHACSLRSQALNKDNRRCGWT